MKKTNVANWIAIVILMIMAAVFIGVGIFLKIRNDSFMAVAEKTTAIITEIETYYDRDSDGDRVRKHRVYVEYTVEGERYEARLDYYNSMMREGGSVDIYYNPQDPGDIMSNTGEVVSYIMIGVGAFLLAIDIIIIVRFVASAKKKKRLISDGTAYTGTIIDVRVITNVKVNGRHPYKADCEVINPLTQEKYMFSSPNVYADIRHLIGSPVVVYMEDNNPANHYVDIDRAIADSKINTGIADYRS